MNTDKLEGIACQAQINEEMAQTQVERCQIVDSRREHETLNRVTSHVSKTYLECVVAPVLMLYTVCQQVTSVASTIGSVSLAKTSGGFRFIEKVLPSLLSECPYSLLINNVLSGILFGIGNILLSIFAIHCVGC